MSSIPNHFHHSPVHHEEENINLIHSPNNRPHIQQAPISSGRLLFSSSMNFGDQQDHHGAFVEKTVQLSQGVGGSNWVGLYHLAEGVQFHGMDVRLLEDHEEPIFHMASLVKNLREKGISNQDIVDFIDHFPGSKKDEGLVAALVTTDDAREHQCIATHPQAGAKTRRAYEIMNLRRSLSSTRLEHRELPFLAATATPTEAIALTKNPLVNDHVLACLVARPFPSLADREHEFIAILAHPQLEESTLSAILNHPQASSNVKAIARTILIAQQRELFMSYI